MFSSGARTNELASEALLNSVRARRTVVIATEGSEELRLLEYFRANANVGGENLTHIILRPDARRVEVLEEFLHGTQFRLGQVQRLGVEPAEVALRQWMIRHRRMLGITEEDARILAEMSGIVFP